MGKFIDLAGQRFGCLTVVRIHGFGDRNRAIWECRCDCGRTIERISSTLRSGQTRSCGCIKNERMVRIGKSKAADLTGKRIGKLLIVSRVESSGSPQWLCRCDCGAEPVFKSSALSGASANKSCGCEISKPVDIAGEVFGRLTARERVSMGRWRCDCSCGGSVVARLSRLRSGKTDSCGCLMSERLREAHKRGAYPRSKGPVECGASQLFRSYSRGAAQRGIAFSLTREQAGALFAGNCFFCGSAPSMAVRATGGNRRFYGMFSGIDRMDNGKGYAPDNCVSCCSHCNRAKASLSMEGFLGLVDRIHRHFENTKDKRAA